MIRDINFVQQRMKLESVPLRADKLTLNAILMYDAIHVFAKALHSLGGNKKLVTEYLKCMGSPFTSWSNGYKLINFMRVVSTVTELCLTVITYNF